MLPSSARCRGCSADMLQKSVVALSFLGLLSDQSTAKPTATIDCRFTPTPPSSTVNISVVNHCGSSAKIRTCSKNFTQCVGYMSSPNHYQDCPARIANGSAVLAVFDDFRNYILVSSPISAASKNQRPVKN